MIELHPVIDFGTFPIFNIMVAIGFILSTILYYYNSKKIPNDTIYKKEDFVIIIGLSFLIGIILSNIITWFLYPEYQNLDLLEKIKSAGYTFYFGLIGFLISLSILIKLFKYNYKIYLNEITPSITLFHALGRIGCLLGGCCYGKICNITFLSLTLDRFPVRELEITFLLLMTIIFQTIIKNNRLLVYLISYPLIRFLLEYQRGDNRGQLFTNALSPSQEISLTIIVTLAIFLLIKKKLKWNHFEI